MENESKCLQQGAGVEIRLDSLKKHLDAKSDKFGLMLETIQDGVSRMGPHLLESMTLTQLWNLEVLSEKRERVVFMTLYSLQKIETCVLLSKNEGLTELFISTLVETQPIDSIVKFVESLLEMLSMTNDEKVLKGIEDMC